MSPEDVPAEWVEKALAAAFRMPDGYAEAHPGVMRDLKVAYGDQHRAALAAVLPLAQAAAWDEGKEALAAALLPDAAPLTNPYREGSPS